MMNDYILEKMAEWKAKEMERFFQHDNHDKKGTSKFIRRLFKLIKDKTKSCFHTKDSIMDRGKSVVHYNH